MKAYASSNVRAQPLSARNWLLFNIWFSLLVIWTSAAATLHIPISRVAWPLLIFSGGLVVFLAFRLRRTRQTWVVNWARIFYSILILGVVFVVLQGCLIKGEFVSVFPDAWAYTAFAAHVQNQVPVIDNGLQPILSFGQHLMGARYGTAGLLALFAEISGTDACRVAGVYAFLVLVQSGLGFALLARSYGAGRNLSLGAGLFSVSIGWVPEIIKIGNWDQVLFLSFIPFILLRSRFLTFQTSGKSGIIGLGICLAAAAFAYPEGAAMAGVIYLPLAIWRLLRGRDLRGKLGRLAIAAAVAILFSGVYLPTFTSWLYMQVLRGTTLDVGKNAFVGLSSAQWLPAIYGLGEQPPLTTVSPLELIVPLLFLGLTLVAVRTWWRKRDGILLTIPVFFLLVLWQAVLLKYNYGFYKILTMFWPVMVMAIFAGMSSLLATMRGWSRVIAVVGFNVLMAGAVFNEQTNLRYSPWGGKREIKPFLELAKLKEYSENAPIGLVTQSWFNQMWAVFFLQGVQLAIAEPLGYLQNPSSGLGGVTSEQIKGAFLLSDERKTKTIWHNEIFWLQDRFEPIKLYGMEAPNGVDTVQGEFFIWLDNRYANLKVYSDADRPAFLTIREFWPGPSRPEDKRRTLIVNVNGEKAEVTASSNLKFPLRLTAGNNLIRLSCKEIATVEKLSSGDNRALLLGIKGFRFATREEPVEISAIEAPNQLEFVQGDSFIWLNNQFTNLITFSDADRRAVLSIHECWPGPSRPGDKKRTLIVEVNGTRTELAASPDLQVPLKLNQGNNVIRLSCKETASVDKLPSHDPRTLLLGIKGFVVTAVDK